MFVQHCSQELWLSEKKKLFSWANQQILAVSLRFIMWFYNLVASFSVGAVFFFPNLLYALCHFVVYLSIRAACFSPRFIILSYQLCLVPLCFLHLVSAWLIIMYWCSASKRDYVLLSVQQTRSHSLFSFFFPEPSLFYFTRLSMLEANFEMKVRLKAWNCQIVN